MADSVALVSPERRVVWAAMAAPAVARDRWAPAAPAVPPVWVEKAARAPPEPREVPEASVEPDMTALSVVRVASAVMVARAVSPVRGVLPARRVPVAEAEF